MADPIVTTSGTEYRHPPVLMEAGDLNSEVMAQMAEDPTTESDSESDSEGGGE
jgi:hypothetical protein